MSETTTKTMLHECLPLNNSTSLALSIQKYPCTVTPPPTVPVVEREGPDDIIARVQQAGRADEGEGGALGCVHQSGNATISATGQHHNQQVNVMGIDQGRGAPVQEEQGQYNMYVVTTDS